MSGDADQRIELTIRLWRAGSKRQFERYINRLLKLAARHGGRAERRAAEVKGGRGRPGAVLVLSFPDTDAVGAYLTDPRRGDLEELAAKAVKRSLITGGRRYHSTEQGPADVTALPTDPADVTALPTDPADVTALPTDPADVTALPTDPG